MSILAGPREQRVSNLGLSDILERSGRVTRSASLKITPDTALKHSVVNAASQMICNLGVMDFNAYQTNGTTVERVKDQPRLLLEPSADLDPIEWRRQIFDAWVRRGTAFGLVTKLDKTYFYPEKIELISPDSVTLTGRRGAPLGSWVWKVDGQEMDTYPHGPLWIARGLHTRTGVPVGISPIEMALGAIGLGLAAEDFAASWFLDGATPSAILESDQRVAEDDAKTIKARFMAAVKGKREPAVLGLGVKYKQIQVAANESQFLETLDNNAVTVARSFLIPPEEIGASVQGSITYSNVESNALRLLQKTYAPWLTRFESTLSRIIPPAQQAKADLDYLVRLDIATRTKVDGDDIRVGLRNRNEVRATRGLSPIEGGDEYVWPPYRAFPVPSDSGGGTSA